MSNVEARESNAVRVSKTSPAGLFTVREVSKDAAIGESFWDDVIWGWAVRAYTVIFKFNTNPLVCPYNCVRPPC